MVGSQAGAAGLQGEMEEGGAETQRGKPGEGGWAGWSKKEGMGEAESARMTLSYLDLETDDDTINQERTHTFPLIILRKSQNRTFD